MQTASKEALRRATDELEQTVSDGEKGTAEALDRISSELYSVAEVLSAQLELRRHLVDPSSSENSRTSLVQDVFGSKVDDLTTQLLTTLVTGRVSTSTDLVEAVETLGRDAGLASAEKDGSLSDVEDELFRFGRILDREPRLRTLLADTATPADKRSELLDSVLGDKVTRTTHRLLEQAVRHPYSRALDYVAEGLAEAAATRRDRSIARVVSPVVLGEEQEQRLADALSQLYGRSVSIQADVDPDLLGGVVVRIGGELIDGSVAGRLRKAVDNLPG